jgi:hypothetical protein
MAAPTVNPKDEDLYRQIKPDLLSKDMEGKFVLIKDGELVEVYDSYQAAYDAAAKAGLKPPFLIKEVTRTEHVETI